MFPLARKPEIKGCLKTQPEISVGEVDGEEPPPTLKNGKTCWESCFRNVILTSLSFKE